MKKTRVVPLRIPEELDELASLSASTEHTDKATALRQWLHAGASQYVVRLVSEGRFSLAYGAELLGVSVYDILRLAEDQGVELGATDGQRRMSRDLATRLGQEGSDLQS